MPALRNLASSPLTSFFLSLCAHDLLLLHMFSLPRVWASTLGALLFLRPELQKTGCTNSPGESGMQTHLLVLAQTDASKMPGVRGLDLFAKHDLK